MKFSKLTFIIFLFSVHSISLGMNNSCAPCPCALPSSPADVYKTVGICCTLCYPIFYALDRVHKECFTRMKENQATPIQTQLKSHEEKLLQEKLKDKPTAMHRNDATQEHTTRKRNFKNWK